MRVRAVGSWESLVRVVLEIYRQMMVGQGIPQEDRGPFRFRSTGQLTCLPTGWLSQYLTQKLLPKLSNMSAVLDFQLCSDWEESAMGRTCDHMTPYDSCRAFHLIQNKSMWHHREIHVTPSEGMRQLQDMWMCDISLVSLAHFQWEIWNETLNHRLIELCLNPKSGIHVADLSSHAEHNVTQFENSNCELWLSDSVAV